MMAACRIPGMLAVFIALALHGSAQAGGVATGSTGAMDKVIQMLTDMVANGRKELHDEQVAFGKFSTWCSEEVPRLKGSIQNAKEEIETMTADKDKLLSDAQDLQDQVAKLNADISQYQTEIKEHTAQREEDHKTFLADNKDYGESVTALERAIVVLEKQNYDRTGAETTEGQEALLQLSSSDQLPAKARAMISAFLGMMEPEKEETDFSTYKAPEANAYEFQSTSIIDVLKRLLHQFKEKKGEDEKEEMKSVHSYKMVMEDLTHAVSEATKNAQEKTMSLNAKTAEAGLLEKQVATTSGVKKEDEKMLSDTTTECEEKKLSFEEKQVLRKEELEALEKAIEILSSEESAGAAAKHLSLSQKGAAKASALVQLHAEGGVDSINRKVREFLSQEASRLHSKSIAMLAEKLQADPFAKVRGLINNMIDRLMAEAHADADKEGFCDKEFGESKLTRTRLQEEIDALKASIDEGRATITMLTQEIATLTKEVADLDTAVKEASEMRADEKAKNKETIEEAIEAADAVQRAVAVLKEFYAKAATATAFTQEKITPMRMGSEEWNSLANPDFEGVVDRNHKAGMQTFGDTYKGMQQEAGGVLALLEVIASDFSKLKADTEASEAVAADEHTKFLRESSETKAVKTKAISMDTSDKAAAEAKLQEDISDLKMTEDKLIAADRYHESIVDQCVDKGMTFEERQAARQEEIKSLKEALSILNSPNVETLAF